MGHRAAVWLAWLLLALCVVLLALTVLLDHYYLPPLPNRGNENPHRFLAVPMVVYATVGAFIASRRTRNLVGWLMCVIGLVFAVLGFSVAYADYVLLARPGTSLPGGVYMACISQSLVVLPTLIPAATLLILLFLDGRLPDRSLRAVPWVVIGWSATGILCAVTAQSIYGRYSLENLLHVGGALGAAGDGFALWLHPATFPKGEKSGLQPIFTDVPESRSLS